LAMGCWRKIPPMRDYAVVLRLAWLQTVKSAKALTPTAAGDAFIAGRVA
jgi:hypothetical protein